MASSEKLAQCDSILFFVFFGSRKSQKTLCLAPDLCNFELGLGQFALVGTLFKTETFANYFYNTLMNLR